MASVIKFYSTTQAKYDALETKDSASLYFIEDTGKIYKGSVDMTSDVSLVSLAPTTLTPGKVQIVKVTAGSNEMYDVYIGDSTGTAVKVQPGVVNDSTALDDTDTYGAYVPSVSAVATWVKAKLDSTEGSLGKAYVSSSFADGTLTFGKSDSTLQADTVDLTGVVHDASWDSTNLKLTLKQYGAESDITVDIPKDMFLQDGEYVANYDFGSGKTGPALVLTVNVTDGTTSTQKVVAIPVDGLIDTYTVSSTSTITLAMADNNITAEIKFDSATLTGDEKIIVKTTDGVQAATKSINDILSEAAADATTKANAAQSAAETTAAADATTKANAAKEAAIAAAATDATTKADAAQSAAETTAAADATTKADAALASAKTYADQAEADAVSTAATDATTKADAALASAKTYTDEQITAAALVWNTLE